MDCSGSEDGTVRLEHDRLERALDGRFLRRTTGADSIAADGGLGIPAGTLVG